MTSGGYRANAGRKKGIKNKNSKPKLKPEPSDAAKIREMLAMGTKAKAKIYQEFLIKVAKDDPLTMPEKNLMQKLGMELAAEVRDDKVSVEVSENDPLEYMLTVMRDLKTDKETRLRAASLAAPYIHPRKGEGTGKKDEKADRAKQAGSGKFKSGVAPLKLVGKQ